MAAKPTLDALLGEILLHEHDLDAVGSAPTLVRNGQVVLADVSGAGRIYWRVNDNTYYVEGTLVVGVPPGVGQPMGLLLALTYPTDL